MYRAVNLIDKDHSVLVKTSTPLNRRDPLANERAVLRTLLGLQSIPTVIWSGTEYEHNVLVFEDLGPTLYDVFKSGGRRMPTNTIAILAEQLVS